VTDETRTPTTAVGSDDFPFPEGEASKPSDDTKEEEPQPHDTKEDEGESKLSDDTKEEEPQPSHDTNEDESVSKPSDDTKEDESQPHDTKEDELQPSHDMKEDEGESKPSDDTKEDEPQPSHDTKEDELLPHDTKEEEIQPHDTKEEEIQPHNTKEKESQPFQSQEEEFKLSQSPNQEEESHFPVLISRPELLRNKFRPPIAPEFIISRLAQQIAPQNWAGRTRKQYSVADFAEFLATSGDEKEPFIEHLKACFTRLSLPITENPTTGDHSVTFWLRQPGQTIEIESDRKWSLCGVFDIGDNRQVPQMFTIGEGSFWREVTVDAFIPLPIKTRPTGRYGIYKREVNDDFLSGFTAEG
jgi:hypothetical protein